MQELFTLSQVIAITGAKRRAVQVWTDRGLLLPEPGTESAGSGGHRQYCPYEVLVAAVLAKLAEFGISIGQLSEFVEQFRRLPEVPNEVALNVNPETKKIQIINGTFWGIAFAFVYIHGVDGIFPPMWWESRGISPPRPASRS